MNQLSINHENINVYMVVILELLLASSQRFNQFMISLHTQTNKS